MKIFKKNAGENGTCRKKGTKNATDGEGGLCAEFAWNPKGNSFYFEEAKHVLHGRPLLQPETICPIAGRERS